MFYRYINAESFSGLEKPDFKKFSGNILLFGAGKIGGVVAHKLNQMGIDFIAFVDNEKVKIGQYYCNRKIISFDELRTRYADSAVIVTSVAKEAMFEQLAEFNIKNVFDAYPLLLEVDLSDYTEYDPKYIERMLNYYFRVIERILKLPKKYISEKLRVVLTSRCTLRCKECCMFIPYVKLPRDGEWETLVRDTIALVDAVGYYNEIELFGGEPFLHPDLAKIVNALRSEPRIGTISLSTNGTIVPDRKTIDAIKNEHRFRIHFSDYGKLSAKRNGLLHALNSNGIEHEYINYKTWYRKSQIQRHKETDEELRKKFNCCMSGNGMMLWDSKLFYCATLAFLSETGAFPPSAENYFDIGKYKGPREELIDSIYEFIDRANTDNYIDACKYCSGKSTANFLNMVPVAEQATSKLDIADLCEA